MNDIYNVLNRHVQPYDFRRIFDNDIRYFILLGYGQLNYDALWKWSALMDFADTFDIVREYYVKHISVDIGGGFSPVSLFAASRDNISINVEPYPADNWFPTDGEYLSGARKFHYDKDNYKIVQKGFFDFANEISDNSIDYFTDGCSIIHFDKSYDINYNDGCYLAGKEIYRMLKPGGWFFVASDVLNPYYKDIESVEQNTGEWLYMENLIKCYTDAGLTLYGDINYSVDKYYSDSNNWCKAYFNNAPLHMKHTPQYCGCQDKPDYHCFCYLSSDLKPLMPCKLVFRKE